MIIHRKERIVNFFSGLFALYFPTAGVLFTVNSVKPHKNMSEMPVLYSDFFLFL